MRDIGTELIEVLPLSTLQAIRYAVQGLILRRMGADFARGPFGVPHRGFKRSPVCSRPGGGFAVPQQYIIFSIRHFL